MKKLGIIAVSMFVLCGALFAAEEAMNRRGKEVKLTFYGHPYNGEFYLNKGFEDIPDDSIFAHSVYNRIEDRNDLPHTIFIDYPFNKEGEWDVDHFNHCPSWTERTTYGRITICSKIALKLVTFVRKDEGTGARLRFDWHVRDIQEALKDGRVTEMAAQIDKWNIEPVLNGIEKLAIQEQLKSVKKSSQPQGHPRADASGHIWPSK